MSNKDKQVDRERRATLKAIQAEQARKFWAAMGNDLIAYLERENAQLKAEVERLRADQDRLNAIRDNLWQVQFNSPTQKWTVQGVGQVWGCIAADRDFRAAIDAARGTK